MKVVKPLEKPSDYVDALEDCGGDVEAFCAAYSPTEDHHIWLFKIERLLSKEPECATRWQKAMQLGIKVRLDLVRHKAVATLEAYQNRSETSSTPDIAYAKLLLKDLSDNSSAEDKILQGGDAESDLDQLEKDLAS